MIENDPFRMKVNLNNKKRLISHKESALQSIQEIQELIYRNNTHQIKASSNKEKTYPFIQNEISS